MRKEWRRGGLGHRPSAVARVSWWLIRLSHRRRTLNRQRRCQDSLPGVAALYTSYAVRTALRGRPQRAYRNPLIPRGITGIPMALNVLVLKQRGRRNPFNSIRGPFAMQTATKNRRNSPRVQITQNVRINPLDPGLSEEVCATENISRNGLYFVTLTPHYFASMVVRVTRNFRPGDSMNREEQAEVVRVERVGNGCYGVSVRIFQPSPLPSW